MSFIQASGYPEAQAAYPPTSGEQPLTGLCLEGSSRWVGILGLATHKTCGRRCHHRRRWALTPPFHPYVLSLPGGDSRLFSVTLSPRSSHGFPLGNMALCVARTFLLPPIHRQATLRRGSCGIRCKSTIFPLHYQNTLTSNPLFLYLCPVFIAYDDISFPLIYRVRSFCGRNARLRPNFSARLALP